MVQYCRKCGHELDDDAEFCEACGYPTKDVPSSKKSNMNLDKKYIIIGLVVIIILALIGIFALTGGNIGDAQYITAETISIDSISKLGTEELSPTEYSDYKGVIGGFKVAYTAKTDLENVSIETQAYDENGEPYEAMANWMGFNPLNVLAYDDNLTAGSSYTANVVFGTQNQTNVDITKLEVYVYQTTPDETKLIDKFTYEVK